MTSRQGDFSWQFSVIPLSASAIDKVAGWSGEVAGVGQGNGRSVAGSPGPGSWLMAHLMFGDFSFDLDARELMRAGTPVSLSPKAFQLLGILVESQARAISKTELQDRLWPGTFVVEKNLTNLVSEIRAALGDDPAHPRFIRTVHRFGYAFRETPVTGGDSDARRHNLPAPLTNFIGRHQEITELRQLVASTRLLTLTGAGGCGKTRLALELAVEVLDRFPDGVWVVELAALSDPGLVAQTVAATLDIREGPHRSLRDALAEYVRSRSMLLLLDNCEHIVGACAQLADVLLRAAEGLSILATSRESLGITGETVWRVPSLSLPEPFDGASTETLSRSDAVRLFAERAAAINPAFAVTGANAATVAEVCSRLDGIPLAIELAAARTNVLSLEQISARLNDRFRLLTGGSRTAVARQRTLEAAVDWSYGLLSDSERQMLRRLSVFAGGWTLEAAEDVTARSGGERGSVLDLLSRLVDKSLVNVDSSIDEGPRYRFLETVRQYARERLVESGEAERQKDDHLAFFHELARRAEPELMRANQIWWLSRLLTEHDNLRLALDYCLAAPERAEQGVELATALSSFWLRRGYFREGQEYVERGLAATGPALPITLRARALMNLGSLTFFQGDLERARLLLEESAALGRATGDPFVVAFSLGMNAIRALELADLAECERLANEGVTVARASTIPLAAGPALAALAYKAMYQGDFERAGTLLEEALTGSREQGEKWGLAITLGDLACLRVVQQRPAEARALCAEGIVLSQECGNIPGVAWCLGILSGAEASDGDALRAARLRGAMESLLESVGAPVQASYHVWIGDRYLGAVQDRLGDSAYQAALAEGRAMSLVRAIQYGLEDATSVT